jgi:16S rRNA (guanine966-N2)-methyltransferase
MATRPTRSLIREALFNIVGARVTDARVIDLFAGAGTVGFEALSRGAAEVVFVDRDRGALAAIAATAERLGCRDRCRIVPGDVLAWARRATTELHAADLCFVDAPYRDPDLERVLGAVAASPPALVVCEHHRNRRLPERIGNLKLVREVRHGLTTLSFLQPITSTNETDGERANRGLPGELRSGNAGTP